MQILPLSNLTSEKFESYNSQKLTVEQKHRISLFNDAPTTNNKCHANKKFPQLGQYLQLYYVNYSFVMFSERKTMLKKVNRFRVIKKLTKHKIHTLNRREDGTLCGRPKNKIPKLET